MADLPTIYHPDPMVTAMLSERIQAPPGIVYALAVHDDVVDNEGEDMDVRIMTIAFLPSGTTQAFQQAFILDRNAADQLGIKPPTPTNEETPES